MTVWFEIHLYKKGEGAFIYFYLPNFFLKPRINNELISS